jgi:hypothetical protein
MNAETSDRVAGIAGRLVQMNENDIYEMARPGNIAALCDLASDIRAVAASALRQHEEDNCATIARRIDEVTAIAADPGNAGANEYLRGMANGLILAQSIVHGEEPEYIEAPTPPETCFYDRLTAERSELYGRLNRLAEFIGHERPTVSVNFMKLDERQQLFLRAQHNFMSAYLMTLDLRIAEIHHSTGQTSVGAYVPPFAERVPSLGEKMLGTATDEAVRHRAELGQPICTCGESKAACPVHEPDLQDAGPGDGDNGSWPGEGGTSDGNMRTTARHSDKPGEIIEEGVRFTKPDPDEPIPFDQ